MFTLGVEQVIKGGYFMQNGLIFVVYCDIMHLGK